MIKAVGGHRTTGAGAEAEQELLPPQVLYANHEEWFSNLGVPPKITASPKASVELLRQIVPRAKEGVEKYPERIFSYPPGKIYRPFLWADGFPLLSI